MSIRVMSAVWSMDLPDSDKIVLLALADCANDEGHCWPSMRSLSAKCSKSDRTIQFSIKRLVADGHLTRREVPGKGCNYTVHPRRDVAPEAASPPKPLPSTPEAASDKPSGTVISEAKASSDGVAEVVSAYNSMAKKAGVKQSRVQDGSLRQKIRLRVKELGLDMVLEAIATVAASPFLRGEGRKTNWCLTLDWLMTPANLRKVLDGAYGGTPEAASSPAEKIQTYEDRAAWFMGHNNEDEAKRLLALAAQLRASATQDNDRRFKPVSAGSAALRIVGGLGTQ